MTLKERVQQNVTFQYFREGELWYKTADGFEFPVAASDTGTGIFRAEDKGIFFMRWIRKHMALVDSWKKQLSEQRMAEELLKEGWFFDEHCNKWICPPGWATEVGSGWPIEGTEKAHQHMTYHKNLKVLNEA
jgi:hypothetical protein